MFNIAVVGFQVEAPVVPTVVSVIAFCLLLKVVQLAELNKPEEAVPDAKGKLRVITGVVVGLATANDGLLPVCVKTVDTLVTVPKPPTAEIVVPTIDIPAPAVKISCFKLR